MKTDTKITYGGIFVGVLTAVVLISYFLIMRAAGLAHILELRLLNLFIILGGVILSVKYHAKLTRGHYNYFLTWFNGALTVVTAVGIFSAFLFFYLTYDQEMMLILQQRAWFGAYLTPVTAMIAAAVEGLASGIIMAYITLSYNYERKTDVSHQR